MIQLTYDVQVVLVLFAQANSGELHPSSDEIAEFDRELKDANEDLMTTILPEMGLPLDTPTKSQVLACKPHMPGNTAITKIRNSCAYIRNTAAVLGAAPSDADVPQPRARTKVRASAAKRANR